ncbi:MAG: alpha/beta fold hydrolase [Actinobacteria bacterium]|uniref:Unannotated protein n=1 Tax=freshwater metagenome TaxID=449393 RepID=A0A6J5YHG0_9ZZZZ|nr:alpha/beta fold hydrolase [Actinomycetota bacterium]
MSLNKRKSPFSNQVVILLVIAAAVVAVLAAITLRSVRPNGRLKSLAPATSEQLANENTPEAADAVPAGDANRSTNRDPSRDPNGAAGDPVIVELVDTSRPLISGGETLDNVRRLPTTVWHPEAAGTYPLVVFAHGYQVGPLTYARFCAALAAMGFVVAAPSFPLADESRGNGLDRDDIPNEASDINFVIAQLRGSDPSISGDPVAVIGHSDGANAALLVAERPDSMNPAIGAVVAIAPDPLSGNLSSSPPPVLIIHGTNDPVASFADAKGEFERFAGSRFLLALDGADHLAPIVGDTPWTPVLDRAVELFLDGIIERSAPVDNIALASALDELGLSYALHAG